jgi:hypothetical protein
MGYFREQKKSNAATKKEGTQLKVSFTKPTARIVLLVLVLGTLLTAAISAIPEGATLATGPPQTKNASVVNNVTADGGNITEVNITSTTQTSSWQGFWGQVNGTLVLQDAAGFNFYSWNVTNVSGEVYASLDGAINFGLIFPENNCSRDNWLTGFDKSDSVNSTFTNNSNRAVNIGIVEINASTACSTFTYVNGSATSVFFHELIVTDDPNNRTNASVGGNTSVYVAIIEPQIAGYNRDLHDYQLIVPVNSTAGFNTYAFYAEIG